MPLFPTKQIPLGFALLLLSSSSAFALDANEFGEHLQAVLKQHGLSLAFSGVESKGDDVLVRGVKFRVGDDRVNVGKLKFENVTGSAEQGFKVARLAVESFEKKAVDTAWRANDFVVEDLRLGGTDEAATTPLPGNLYLGRLALGEFTTRRNSDDDFKLTGLEFVTGVAEGGMVTSQMNFESFEVDLSPHEKTDFVKAVEELGYQTVSGSASAKATWEPSTGEWKLSPFQLRIKDAGTFELSTSVVGVTRSFAESLGNVLEDEDPATISFLRPVWHLSLKQYQGFYFDEGLANRLVDFYADTSNLPRDEVIAKANTIIRPLLDELDNEAFQNSVGSAGTNLLMDPASRSLSVTIEPESPLSLLLIVGAAIGSPESLPDVLGAQVRANQKAPEVRAGAGVGQGNAAGGGNQTAPAGETGTGNMGATGLREAVTGDAKAPRS